MKKNGVTRTMKIVLQLKMRKQLMMNFQVKIKRDWHSEEIICKASRLTG